MGIFIFPSNKKIILTVIFSLILVSGIAPSVFAASSVQPKSFPPRSGTPNGSTNHSIVHTKIAITPSLDPAVIKAAILAGGGTGIDPASVVVTVNGLTSGPASSVGTFVNPSHTYGMGPGIVMSTGDVNAYNDGPNLNPNTSTAYGVPETLAQKALLDPITTPFPHFDVTQIDVTFDMLPGFDHVFYNTVFGSEEFPEFVGSVFIDGFGMYLNGVNIAQVAGQPVNINHPFMGPFPGTELDGVLGSAGPSLPLVHTFSGPVNPTGNKLTFIIADSSDPIYDSTVYISQLGGSPPPPENEDVVGGMGIPIDTTALLLAGVQGSSFWMIPGIVIAGAGIGLVSFRKSKKVSKKD